MCMCVVWEKIWVCKVNTSKQVLRIFQPVLVNIFYQTCISRGTLEYVNAYLHRQKMTLHQVIRNYIQDED